MVRDVVGHCTLTITWLKHIDLTVAKKRFCLLMSLNV